MPAHQSKLQFRYLNDEEKSEKINLKLIKCNGRFCYQFVRRRRVFTRVGKLGSRVIVLVSAANVVRALSPAPNCLAIAALLPPLRRMPLPNPAWPAIRPSSIIQTANSAVPNADPAALPAAAANWNAHIKRLPDWVLVPASDGSSSAKVASVW